MADYNIKAEITADASGFESGIKKAQKASKNLSSTVSGVVKGLGKNGLVGALGAVGLASSGLSATLGTVVKVARQVSKTINECTEAYKTQLVAERALNTAIENNPFVTGASANALKQFASEMQKVSNYGDEELIPMMTNLISLGRTESETMQIMSVAMDMSAGMGISLDSAITQLNATLNGNIGRLGQQNAELKGLTEEELKQGKAIEILGEKFKGLSSATADTSKQLQNIKGDFKEALGQFTLPSSDMWNTFWAGFYEKGIEIINKLDAYMDAEILGKKLSKALEEQVKKIKNEGDKGSYLRGALDIVTDSELQYLNDYLSGLRKINKDQQKILEFVQKEQEARKFVAEEEARFAKLKADRLKQEEEEKRLAEEKAKKEKELAELREKQLKVQKEWEDKLFAIRIENLERQRDLELENEELTEEQKIAISDFYGEQILAMKIKQIEKERDEALQGENVTEEAREKIRLYYENKITQIKQDESKKRVKATKQEVKEEKKDFEQLFATIKRVGETITDAFKNTFSKMKSVAGKIGNVLKSVFEFNADDALDNLLVFEDKILTFFVETLPKLPNFFASAIQSISVLFKSLGRVIDFNVISDILKTIVQGVADWVSGGGWKDLLDLVLALQMAVEKAVEENIDLVVETLEKMLPDLVTTLTKSIVSASQTLGKIAKVLLPLVAKIINAIVDVITSNEVVQSSVEAVEGIVEGLIPAIVDILIKAGPKISNLLSFKLPLILPQMIVTVITAIINAIEKMDFSDIVDAMFDGFDDALNSFSVVGLAESLMKLFKKTMSLDFWIDVLSNFATAIGSLLMNTVQRIFSNPTSLITGSSSGGGTTSSGNSTASVVTSAILTGGLSLLWKHANGTNATHRGLAIVGEAGPEIVNFRGGEQVLNNRNTNKALAEMGGKTNNFNVTFNNLKDTTAFNMMQQLKAYNRSMAINGII
jgi:hypothetical protein